MFFSQKNRMNLPKKPNCKLSISEKNRFLRRKIIYFLEFLAATARASLVRLAGGVLSRFALRFRE